MAKKYKRKSLSKKTRFEVFKRDSFTCQYCGRKAPDVVLEVDHIKPVAKGGDNNITNLVTSCHDCNSGKGARKLNDKTVINKQMKELALLQEKREQIDMIFKWREELRHTDDYLAERVAKYINNYTAPEEVNEHGKSIIRVWLKRYSLDALLKAIDTAFSEYTDTQTALSKIGGIAYYQKEGMPKTTELIFKLCALLKGHFNYVNRNYMFAHWKDQIEDHYDEMAKLANESTNWSEYRDKVDELLYHQDELLYKQTVRKAHEEQEEALAKLEAEQRKEKQHGQKIS